MEKKPHILVAESRDFPEKASNLLQTVGMLTLGDLNRTQLLSAVQDADVLWVRLRHRVDAEILAHAPHLRMIATPTTGLNHIELAEAERRGIQILSLRGETEFLETIRATAEHTLGLTLTLLRHIQEASRHSLEGRWNRDLFKGREIYEKTVGIVGYGRLGRIVSGYFLAFGARVLCSDPNINIEEFDEGVNLVPLPILLEGSDIVSVHVSLSQSTRGFFDKSCFAMMKQGSYLINSARGELLDEVALLNALKSGHLAGAALDVISDELQEGFEFNPLFRYASLKPNLIITPHIGGCTYEATAKTEIFLAERLAIFLSKQTLGQMPIGV